MAEEPNIRYVVTGIRESGLRGLVGAMQGVNTFATPQEAANHLQAMRTSNSVALLNEYCGRDLAVCRCRCYPGHNDPMSCWFDEEDVVSR